MQSSATFFLTVPASVDTHEEQAIALKKSLERHHKAYVDG